MRRLALLAAVIAAAFAPSASSAAWTETATYDVPGGGIADCLRAAGTDRLALLGSLERISTPINLLELKGGHVAPVATSTLGWLPDCPEIATADGAPPLAAGIVLLPHGRGHFGTALRVATFGEVPQTLRPAGGTPSVATAPGGAAIVAWIKRRPILNGKARVMAAIRPSAGTPFGTPTAVDSRPADHGDVVAGIDAAGRAVVAWRTRSPRNFLQQVTHVAAADAGGRFEPPRTLTLTRGWSLALAVAPDGRALLAAEGRDGLHAYERLPSQADFTRVPLPSVPYVQDLAVALNADGGAVIAYRTDPWSTAALVRPAGGAFREGGDIAVRRLGNFRPLESAFASPLVSSLGTHAEPPDDMAGQDLAVALTPSGQMLMTWVQDEESKRAASAYVARGTLTDGFGAPSRVGGACRSATAARPLHFGDDVLGVAWADDARVETRQGGLRRLGGGRAHVARDLAPGGPSASAPAAPRMSVRLMGPPALRATEPLRVRVRCERPCDVRAVATARTLPQPWWSVFGRRGGARQVLDASDALHAGGETTLRLDPGNGSNAAGARGFPRTPIVVLGCTPGNAVAERIELPAPRALPPGRIPSITGLAARRRGDLVQATWRTTAPARRMHFTAYLLLAGGVHKPIVARVAGRGRTRFAATLHMPHGRQATRMGVVMRGPDLRLPDQTVVDVR
ncbi:MAG TPA: hypothetical protein VKB03_08090 [Conexibacter sp.]|nr:hypothetical protein [Conexibacter sp.]